MADTAAKIAPKKNTGISTQDPVYQQSAQAADILKKIRDEESKNGGIHLGDPTATDHMNSNLDALYNQYNDQVKQDRQAYEVQDQFSSLIGQQKNQADQFRTAFPSIVDNQMAPERVQARRAIAQGTSANKTNYNQRGLLYSGLRAGGEADVTGNVSDQLNAAKSNINQNLTAQQQTLDQAPIDTALAQSSLQGQQANVNNDYTNSVIDALMNKQNQNTSAVNSLIGAGGQLAGTAVGGLINNPVTSSPAKAAYSANPYLNQPINFGNTGKSLGIGY